MSSFSEPVVRVRLSPPVPASSERRSPSPSPLSPRGGRLTTRFSYFDNKKVSKMEARASREAQRSRSVRSQDLTQDMPFSETDKSLNALLCLKIILFQNQLLLPTWTNLEMKIEKCFENFCRASFQITCTFLAAKRTLQITFSVRPSVRYDCPTHSINAVD